MLYKALI